MIDRLNQPDLKDANVWVKQVWMAFLAGAFVYVFHEDGLLLTLSTPEFARGWFASLGWLVDAFIVYFIFVILDILGDFRAVLRDVLEAQSDTENKE